MSLLLANLPFVIWVVFIVTVCAAAWATGGVSERVAAAAFMGAWLASLALARIPGMGYGLGVAVLDMLLLIVLVGLALKSTRYWPLFAAGFHLLAVMTHWAAELDPSVGSWTYQTANIIWGYLPLAALAFGTWGAWRERQLAAKAGTPLAAPGATRL